MAVNDSELLEQLRDELRSSGYEAVVLDDALTHVDDDRSVEQALDDLLDLLQRGVVTAMFAHAASIRLLQSRPGPHGKLWEPPPRRSTSPVDDEEAFALRLDRDQADRLEELAQRLDDVLVELRSANADED